MRKAFLFVFSVAMFVGGLWLLSELFFAVTAAPVTSPMKIVKMSVLAGALLTTLGAYLLWSDFIAPLLGISSDEPSWERQYAENIYGGLVGGEKLGDITPERLRIPLASYRQYEEKDLLLRELMVFVALMVAANKDTVPELVLRQFGHLLVSKLARGHDRRTSYLPLR